MQLYAPARARASPLSSHSRGQGRVASESQLPARKKTSGPAGALGRPDCTSVC